MTNLWQVPTGPTGPTGSTVPTGPSTGPAGSTGLIGVLVLPLVLQKMTNLWQVPAGPASHACRPKTEPICVHRASGRCIPETI